MTENYKGISFPFRYGANGGANTSELTMSDSDRIKESVNQILLTRKGERINNPEIGSNIHHYLFESSSDVTTLALIKDEIEECLSEQEPRIELQDVRVYTLDEEEGKIFVEIDFIILQFAKDETLQLELETMENLF